MRKHAKRALLGAAMGLGSSFALVACTTMPQGVNTSNGSAEVKPGGTSTASATHANTAHENASISPVTISLSLGLITSNPQGQKKMVNDMIAKFEKQNPGIKVTWSTWDSASQEDTDIETMTATGQGPTIMDVGPIPTAYATHGFHVLSAADWKAIGGKSRYFAKQLTMSGPSASQEIGIPWEINPFALVYNKKMFQEAGIKSPPTTWTQFVKDAQKLTKPSKDQWGTGIDPADSIDPWHINWVMAKQLGGDFLNSNYTKATLNSKPVQTALSFWFDWVNKFKIASPNDLDYKSTDLVSAFQNQKIAMLPMQSYAFVPSLNASAVKNDWAYAPMPTIPYGMSKLPKGGTPVQTFTSGDFLVIPTYVQGAQYQAALKWINFFTSVPQQREIFNSIGYLPVNVDAYKNYKPLETPTISMLEQAENHAYPYPFSGNWGNVEVAFGGAANQIADEIATKTYKNGDIASALNAANEQIQNTLQ
ncbi:carbohydrate ABC transporter substrate-binding protein (CUT1 family) [Alicyclobacillus sacchari]|uniref:Carbohydrate ABC transporter substrate-binding protein (CUT1 family) n=1 Tax=Alicyclobacillus sacchari TaxID=392010 RepID=A0A4R8LGE9_9BACL|nr:sugar ABC transporter substrate-binding protein [Alicyclobacillus sacchari]TDY42177.1 carbohydrate ABC transporter substrate-binding protein (CUT1 family) [Alicyclobacillus sacchari]GMA58933.1 hypothetical protein GCM10025858_34360 [Alicyclobacillus sacchari]